MASGCRRALQHRCSGAVATTAAQLTVVDLEAQPADCIVGVLERHRREALVIEDRQPAAPIAERGDGVTPVGADAEFVAGLGWVKVRAHDHLLRSLASVDSELPAELTFSGIAR